MNTTDLSTILDNLSETDKQKLIKAIQSKAIQKDKEEQKVKRHVVFECRITKPNGQFAIGKVMVEPADRMFVTRARARGAGRRKFGKTFMYLIGLEAKTNYAYLEPVLQTSLF